jgi:phosphotransferase system HPr-like phosphotransfer protein
MRQRMTFTTNTAAAKRTPSGVFARPASALADGGQVHWRRMTFTTNTAAAKRTPSGVFARPASALADGGQVH